MRSSCRDLAPSFSFKHQSTIKHHLGRKTQKRDKMMLGSHLKQIDGLFFQLAPHLRQEHGESIGDTVVNNMSCLYIICAIPMKSSWYLDIFGVYLSVVMTSLSQQTDHEPCLQNKTIWASVKCIDSWDVIINNSTPYNFVLFH